VTAELDGGPILLQDSAPIVDGDTVETLRARVHEVEHRILPEGIRMMEAKLADRSSVS
jgi:phosphoribosylglycinamide formyltransferase-1